MSAFNSRQGFSVGTTPTNIVDASANITGTTVGISGGTAFQLLKANGTVLTLPNSGGTTYLKDDGTFGTPSATVSTTDDTTTNAVYYPVIETTTSSGVFKTSSSKLNFNPSTGILTATGFSGSGASLTSLTAGNLSGTIPSAVLGNSSIFIGTTSVALNRGTGALTLAGVSLSTLTIGNGLSGTSYNGSAAVTVAVSAANNTTAASYFPVFATTQGTAVALGTKSTFTFNASTNALSVGGAISGTTLTSTVATGTAPFTVTSTTAVANLSIGGTAAVASTVAALIDNTATGFKIATVSATNGNVSVTTAGPYIVGNTGLLSTTLLNVTSSTASTSYLSGAAIISGGVGIAGRLNVADRIINTSALISNAVQSYAPSNGGTVNIDCSLANLFIITLPNTAASSITFGTPSNPTAGQSVNVIFAQGATNGTSVTMPANTVIKFISANKTVPTTAGTIHMLSMVYSSAGYWIGSLGTNAG